MANPFKLMAPQHGLEPRTRWLIPPWAGLYQLSFFEVATNSAVFDLSFERYSLTSCRTLHCPDELPWPFPYLRSPGQSVFRIVVLANAAINIFAVSAIIPTG